MAKKNSASDKTTPADTISLRLGLAYSSPLVAITLLLGPIGVLQGIYAKYFGVALTTIAIVLFVGRLVDAVTDPVIGYLSDRYYARTGSRKPFIISGAILLIICGYFLYVPTEFFTSETYGTTLQTYPNVSGTYFLVCLLLFYCAWTLFEIPHLAWGGELAPGSREKNKIYSLRALAISTGGLLFFAIPYLPFFESHDITPLTLQWSVLIAGVLMLPLLYISIKNVPNGPGISHHLPINNNRVKAESIGTLLKTIFKNKPFLLFVSAFLFTGIGSGSMSVMYFFFIDSYLDLGDKFALISMVSLFAGILCIGVWYKLAIVIGKKICWGLAMLIVIICLLGFSQLTPDGNSFIPLLILMTMITCGGSALGVIPASVLADIVDYGTWKFGMDYSASYFSFYTLMVKANIALGSAIGLSVAGWYGFNAAATSHSAKNVFGLHLSIAYIPALFFTVAIVFVFLIPINEKKHGYIRRQLDNRAASNSLSGYEETILSTKHGALDSPHNSNWSQSLNCDPGDIPIQTSINNL